MDQNKPLISIIMPVYNGEKYIEDAIQSVLKQTHNQWELLIINDGSRDQSENIILNIPDMRIQYFKQENKGVSAARNIGLSNMKGDFFCFLDADDLLPSNSIVSRLSVFEADDAVEFVDGQVEVFDSETKEVLRSYSPDFKGNPLKELVTLSGKCFFGITWMIKRDEKKVYRFKEGLTHGEDLLFFMSISRNSGVYLFSKDLSYKCRQGHISAMSDLEKLESGYNEIFTEISNWENLSRAQLSRYRKKSRSIMFKSYLGEGNIYRAIKVLFK